MPPSRLGADTVREAFAEPLAADVPYEPRLSGAIRAMSARGATLVPTAISEEMKTGGAMDLVGVRSYPDLHASLYSLDMSAHGVVAGCVIAVDTVGRIAYLAANVVPLGSGADASTFLMWNVSSPAICILQHAGLNVSRFRVSGTSPKTIEFEAGRANWERFSDETKAEVIALGRRVAFDYYRITLAATSAASFSLHLVDGAKRATGIDSRDDGEGLRLPLCSFP